MRELFRWGLESGTAVKWCILGQPFHVAEKPYYRDSTATKPLPLQTKYRTQSDKIASTALELIRTLQGPIERSRKHGRKLLYFG